MMNGIGYRKYGKIKMNIESRRWKAMYFSNKLWNPEIFQGKYKNKNYFEGWYYKVISGCQENILAIIPGVSYGNTPKEAHAFIQVINGTTCETYYFNYALYQFWFSEKAFKITIGDNIFTNNYIYLNLSKNKTAITGRLVFHHIVPFPKTLKYPGIMGPYSFMPFMECYHGIVNMHHEVKGSITINNKLLDFSEGYGYIEKNWGKSFPQSWIWLQSNHFTQEDTSIMFSIAKIPWFNHHFIGFLSFLRVKGKLYRFTTYTKANIESLQWDENHLKVTIQDQENTLLIDALYTKGGMLKAPIEGKMTREIFESITSIVKVRLYDKNKALIFEDEGKNTGMELAGDINIFISNCETIF